jgi:hypothetical protein
MIIPRLGTLIVLLFSGALAGAPARRTAQIPVVAGPQSGFFPVFGSDRGEFTGLSMTNNATAVNAVTVTWSDADGSRSLSGSLSLSPGFQRVALLREILGIPEDPPDGWVRIDSTEPGLLCYISSGRDGILDGSESASTLSTRIILPHVAVNTGFMELEYTDTLISLVNPGSAVANARTELIGLDGNAVGNLTIPVPARGSRSLMVSEAFRNALPANNVGGRAFAGYMRVSSDAGLSGWLRIDTPLSRRLLRGRGAEEIVPSPLLMASHFASGSASLYRSGLNCINAGNGPVTIELVAQDNRGGSVGQAVRRTLNPGEAIRDDVLSLFRVASVAIYPPPMIDGYIRIRAADGGTLQAVGDVAITCGNTSASMIYPIGEPFSSDATMPFVISDTDYFTGYAIANSNELLTVQTDVTVTLLDGNGRAIGYPRVISLSPSARFVSLIEEKVRGGYLRIHANGPFAVLGSIGTRNCSTLAQLPGLP